MKEYIKAFNEYYYSVSKIKEIISNFNEDLDLPFENIAQYGFTVKPGALDKRMLTPNFYRHDVRDTINLINKNQANCSSFESGRVKKGDEIGSANYLEEGIPFIKTSNILNFDIDYEPDCFCSESYLSQLNQDIRCGDIIFAKDGKPGEVAIILEDNKIVISSGLVKYRPKDENDRCWTFLLLTSKYGDSYFKKWFVIASTMLHLRSDFFDDFSIPPITEEIKHAYLEPLSKAFEAKHKAFTILKDIKTKVEESFTNNNAESNSLNYII